MAGGRTHYVPRYTRCSTLLDSSPADAVVVVVVVVAAAAAAAVAAAAAARRPSCVGCCASLMHFDGEKGALCDGADLVIQGVLPGACSWITEMFEDGIYIDRNLAKASKLANKTDVQLLWNELIGQHQLKFMKPTPAKNGGPTTIQVKMLQPVDKGEDDVLTFFDELWGGSFFTTSGNNQVPPCSHILVATDTRRTHPSRLLMTCGRCLLDCGVWVCGCVGVWVCWVCYGWIGMCVS